MLEHHVLTLVNTSPKDGYDFNDTSNLVMSVLPLDLLSTVMYIFYFHFVSLMLCSIEKFISLILN